jgi:hypothetical protein
MALQVGSRVFAPQGNPKQLGTVTAVNQPYVGTQVINGMAFPVYFATGGIAVSWDATGYDSGSRFFPIVYPLVALTQVS